MVGPTLDSQEIIDEIASYYAHNGGDCPEMAMTGIEVSSFPNIGLYGLTLTYNLLCHAYSRWISVSNLSIADRFSRFLQAYEWL